MMTLFPSVALAACVVYLLSGHISHYCSANVTSVIDLVLFVTVMVATNTFLKNLRDG